MDFYKLMTHLLDSTHRPVNESEDESITNQKREWFVDRTNRHIDLVRKSAHKIVGSYPEFKALLDQVKHHDESKFNEPEMTPYIGISWSHKIGNETGNKPAPTKEENEATLHHITTNSHHPEYHLKDRGEANISDTNRDQSKKCVDVSSMPDLDIVEMVADWQAMSEELGTNTSRQWFNKVQDTKWQFSQHQVKLIDTILKVFEDTNESVNEVVSEEAMHSFMELQDEVDQEVVDDWMKNRNTGSSQPWEVINSEKLKRVWSDRAKLGFIRDERSIQKFADIIVKNTMKLRVNTTLMSHSAHGALEDVLVRTGITEEDLEGFEEYAVDEHDRWRISDHALGKLTNVAMEILSSKSSEDLLILIDRVLNIVHIRSDLSSWFVAGGKRTLDKLANESVNEEGSAKPIRVGMGQSGGKLIHPSARGGKKTQVTSFTDEGVPSGHEEYNTVADAIVDNWDELDNPVSRLAFDNIDKRSRAWEEATFEHPYKDELLSLLYHYISPRRPLSGVSVEGKTSSDKAGRVGVLYRDTPLDIETMTRLDLFPYTKEAVSAFSQELSDVILAKTGPNTTPPQSRPITEEGAGVAAAPAAQASPGSSGTTTEDNISYLPAHMGERGKSRKVKKKKRKRNLVGESLVNERGGFIYPSGKAVNMSSGGEHWEEAISDPNLVDALQYRIYNSGTLIIRLNSSPTTAQLISLKKEVKNCGINVDSIELDMEYKNPKNPTIVKQLGSEPWVTISPVPWNWTSIIQNRYNNALKNSKITEFRVGEMELREAINKDLKSLRSDFKVQLNKLFDGESFLLLGNHLSSWKATFGVSAFRTNKVAVPVENKSRGIQNIYGKLLREYGKDKGNLEMLISAIQDGRPLGQFSVFDKFDNLFGSRTESIVDGIKVIFEETIDFILDLSQSIYISDPEVLDLVEEEFKGLIKRSKNVIFPIGGKFKIGFYSHLKSVIEDSQSVEEDNNEGSQNAEKDINWGSQSREGGR